jgi:uncharacterized protein
MNLTNNEKLILQQFFAARPVKKAYLFGSYARNEADKNSDIDLLVELDYSKHIGFGFVQMQLDLEEMLRRKVDLVTDDSMSKYIRPYVDKEKILIYERAA